MRSKESKLKISKIQKNKKIRNQKGITLIALIITVVIMLILAGVAISAVVGDDGLFGKANHSVGIYENVANDEQEYMKNIIKLLDKELNLEKIPIYTAEQLIKIGTGEEININGDKYEFNLEKNYILQNDIEYTGDYEKIANLIKNGKIKFTGQNYKIVVNNQNGIKEYYTSDSKYYIATNKYGYVLEGLELFYDGIDNSGEGTHSNATNAWKDLSGNNRDGILNNFGTNAISGWNNEFLSLDGVNDWVNCGEFNNENITLEAVHRFKSNTIADRCILGDWENGGVGIFALEGTYQANLYNNSQYKYMYSNINTSNYTNKITTQSLSYNGNEGILYINGEEKAKEMINGDIETAKNNTVMAIGVNPSGDQGVASYSDIDVFSIRIYNRGLSSEEIEINNKADNKRFKNQEIIPIYTEEQLFKVGTGEEITVEQENKTYTYGKNLKYELKNDIVIYNDYTSIVDKINNKEVEILLNDYNIINNDIYYMANSKYTIPVNKYGYVVNGLQLLLDAKDNTGIGEANLNASVWKDLSGNNRNGTLKNMDISNCWQSDGLKFDGIDDYVLIAEMNYDNITLEVVNTMGTTKDKSLCVVSNVDGGGYGVYQDTNNRFRFGVYISEDSKYYYASATGQIGYDNLSRVKYSISGSYDGKTIKMRTSNGATSYQELSLVGTIGKPVNNTYMVLGDNPKGNDIEKSDQTFNGIISSVRIYDRALTDEENAVNYLQDRKRYEV